MTTQVTSLEIARVAALAADAKKAEDIQVLDLSGLSDVTDAIVICTAANSRLADSVIDEVEERVREQCGIKPLAIEGRADGRWILIDFGSVICHVFSPEARDYYRLEHLWNDAPHINIPLVD